MKAVSTILKDGQPIPDVETLFDTMHNHFSTSAAESRISWTAINDIPQRPERSFPLISLKELWDALRPTTNSSAPGPDHVTWRHVKLALSFPETDTSLVKLFNNVCRMGVWPTHFKDSFSVIIPKPNKSDYTIPKSYRPIALLNTIGKLLTKILANRLQHDSAEYGLLHRDQFGGIQKHATIDAGLTLVDFISFIASLSLTTTTPPHFRHSRLSLPSAIYPFLVPTTLQLSRLLSHGSRRFLDDYAA